MRLDATCPVRTNRLHIEGSLACADMSCSTASVDGIGEVELSAADVGRSCSTPLRKRDLNESAASQPSLPSLDVGELNATIPASNDSYHKILKEWKTIDSLCLEQDVHLRSIRRSLESSWMLGEWEALEEMTDELERKCSLQRDITDLQNTLRKMSNASNTSAQLEDRLQLENNVKIVKAELDSIGDMKNLIHEYKALADQLAKDAKYTSLSLEDDIRSLYQVWTDAQQKTARNLTMLEQALLMWSEFDKHMLELKMVLREDYTALNALDQALKTEDGSVDMTSAMQNIVKYLPENRREGLSTVNNCNGMSHMDGVSSLLRSTLNAEGSFSDSGISDSGSEQDMFDREKHLALLRKLARHLEAILAPGSEALLNIMKKIDEAEEEIRELQQTYRTIKTDYLEKSERCSQQLGKEQITSSISEKNVGVGAGRGTCPGDPGADPSRERSMFWRVLRAALPFHMVFVVFLCVACLLEQPNCCDTINNLNLSWSPRLRYISGPPPT